MKTPRRTRSTTRLGCGYLTSIGALICVLFLANLMFVKAFVGANFPAVDFRVTQAAYSIIPVVLIFVEFWLFDMIASGRYRNGK